MRALDLKLLRDFRRLWAQALAIALVLGCGVTVMLMSFGMSAALDESRSAYYERNRFADIFVQARRAPRSLIAQVREIPGVSAVEARVAGEAILDVPGRTETSVGRILSLPETGEPRLNVPLLRSGDWPDPESVDTVVLNERFARANDLQVGDTIGANLDGRKRTLTVVGSALSPEFIYTIGPGALMPDDAGYGILWMSERGAAAAFDMQGAFNDLSLALSAGTDEAAVIDLVDELLEPYGGLGAYGRDLQVSDAFVESEITSLKTLAYVLPPVFLGISVFLVNMVIGRIVALERSEIGLLKAIGYGNWEISLHYILLAGLIAVAGIAIGWAGGSWLARQMAQIYARFYDFPYLIYRMPAQTYLLSGLLAFAAATLGATQSAMRAARLPPAVAMAPPGPASFRRNLPGWVLSVLRLSQPTMMILRSIARWPARAALTMLGLALATSVLVASGFFNDALDEMMDIAFYQSNRQDASLVFSEDVPLSALEEVRRLPGVLAVEPQVVAPAILRHGHLSKRVAIEARPPGSDLSRVIDRDGRVVQPEGRGVLLSDRLAEHLELRPGDTVTVEFLSGPRETVELAVDGTVTQSLGLGAYMQSDALDALFRRSGRISAANVTLEAPATDAFHAALRDIPKLTGAIFMTENRTSFMETIGENQSVMTGVYAALGVMISVGVAYNAARVQLSERARELASLRILGFTRAEVSYVLIGEVMLLALVAQPVGWWIGTLIARLLTSQFSSDLYVIPLVLNPDTFARASLWVLGAVVLSLLVVRRRLDRLDLVAVMKTRE